MASGAWAGVFCSGQAFAAVAVLSGPGSLEYTSGVGDEDHAEANAVGTAGTRAGRNELSSSSSKEKLVFQAPYAPVVGGPALVLFQAIYQYRLRTLPDIEVLSVLTTLAQRTSSFSITICVWQLCNFVLRV